MDSAYTAFDVLPDLSRGAPAHPLPIRGVGWVLQWAAALAVLLCATVTLLQSAYSMAAGLALNRAARAGALEATLPRATCKSVAETVERRLAGCGISPRELRLYFEQNGRPVRGEFTPRAGDFLSVSLAAPPQAVLPSWLRRVTTWSSDGNIQAQAERRMPGRELQPRRIDNPARR